MCALEAMAVGTPVVSTPSDGMKDIVHSGISGWLGDTDEELAEGAMKILSDDDYRQTLAQNAKANFETMNDEKAYLQTLLDCYHTWVKTT